MRESASETAFAALLLEGPGYVVTYTDRWQGSYKEHIQTLLTYVAVRL